MDTNALLQRITDASNKPLSLVAVFIFFAAIYLSIRRGPPPPPKPSSTSWTPSPYILPTPPPYPDWSITTTKPLPYRPFRHGPKYHITMGLRTIPPSSWIELDSDYPQFHHKKAARLASSRGPHCVRTAPSALPAAEELLSDLASYLPARYPSLFRRTETGGIENLWSGETFPTTRAAAAKGDDPWDPMAICARLVQDDLALMLPPTDGSGEYRLLAGAILLPGFWRLQDKFGMSLSAIHTSGGVPQFETRLQRGMVNLFRRLKPEEVVARNNYFMQVDDDLAWSWSIGSEESGEAGWDTAAKDRAIEHHMFRSERQTLRRLPRTGAVVFTIRTYFVPVTEIVKEPYVPGRLASAVRSWGDDVAKYKGKERYGRVLLEYLDEKHAEQVANGLDLEREDEMHSYPF